VFDTDVASHSFRDRLPPRLAARLVGRQPLLTFVTVGELAKWTRLRHWGPRNLAMLEDWLSNKPIIPASRQIAVTWGDLSAAAIQRGRPRPVNDTWIAACCLAYDVPLATLNLKDFEDFAEHHGLRLLRS
jgi:predicted nucleic acid-binding protein